MENYPKLRIIYQPRGRAREYAPLAANLYNGCGNGCRYCYVPAIMKIDRETFNAGANIRDRIIKKLDLDLRDMQKWEKTPPIYFSFTTDPYNHLDREIQLMRSAVKMIKEYGFRIQILTKSGLYAARDFDLLDKEDTVASTLTFMDPTKSQYWEPRAELPKQRIELLKRAKEKGFRTWVSLEPVIEPDETMACIDASHEYVDLYKVGKLNHYKTDIDWHKFGEEVQEKLIGLNKEFYIKDDLKKHTHDHGLTLEEIESRLVQTWPKKGRHEDGWLI